MLSLRYQQGFRFGPTCSFTSKIIRDQSQPSHYKMNPKLPILPRRDQC